MSTNSNRPEYDAIVGDWLIMRHTVAGARVVKEQGPVYLPIPTGFAGSRNPASEYDAYRTRAQFPEIVEPTVRGMTGIICRTELQVELPDALMGLWERATNDGATLEALHRRITRELLTTGRYVLLVDVPINPALGEDLPTLVGYRAEALTDWSDESDYFVLDESRLVRGDGSWSKQERWRVLELVDGVYQVTTFADAAVDSEEFTPARRGGGTFDKIPLVVTNATGDIGPEIDKIPLLGVAEAALATYRLDADYRFQLYMSGQETLCVIGVADDQTPRVVGASTVITLPAGADAKYLSPSGSGIAAHRLAIADERAHAVMVGAALFDEPKKAAESGVAMKLRFAGQTATLTSIAQASAQGLERALRFAAEFVGADPAQVVVKPNLSFIDATMTPQAAVELVKVWQSGAISKKTLHENLQRGEIASAERDFDEEEALIENELPEVDPLEQPPGDQEILG